VQAFLWFDDKLGLFPIVSPFTRAIVSLKGKHCVSQKGVIDKLHLEWNIGTQKSHVAIFFGFVGTLAKIDCENTGIMGGKYEDYDW
jgi:hypothetical protein